MADLGVPWQRIPWLSRAAVLSSVLLALSVPTEGIGSCISVVFNDSPTLPAANCDSERIFWFPLLRLAIVAIGLIVGLALARSRSEEPATDKGEALGPIPRFAQAPVSTWAAAACQVATAGFLVTRSHWHWPWEPVLPSLVAVLLGVLILRGNRVDWVIAVAGSVGKLVLILMVPALVRVHVPGIGTVGTGTLRLVHVLWPLLLLQAACAILLLNSSSRRFAGISHPIQVMEGSVPLNPPSAGGVP